MTSVQPIQETSTHTGRAAEFPPSNAAPIDPFAGLLSRFAAGGREIATTGVVPSGVRTAPFRALKPGLDAQSERERAQERLAESVRIAQSHDLPSGLGLGTPRDLTQQAVERMTTRGTAGEQANSRPEAAQGRAKEPSKERPVAGPADPRPQSSPATRVSEAPGPEASRPAVPRDPVATKAADRPQAASSVGVTSAVSSARAITPVILGGRTQGAQPGPATRTNSAAPALRALSGGAFRLGTTRVTRSPSDPVRHAATPQVVRGLALALKQGGGRVTLRLSPDNLGSVVINVKVEGTKVTARLDTSGAAAHQLLKDSIDSLRSALEARGLSVERIEIAPPPSPDASPSGHPSGGPPGDAGQDRSAHRHAERAGGNGPAGAPEGLDTHPDVVTWMLPASVRITHDGPENRPRLEAVA